MKHLKSIGAAIGFIVLGGAIYQALSTGEQSPILAAGKILLKDNLAAEANGIRTLFIVLYDLDSPKPMPYGAVKEVLDQDPPAGEFFDFLVTREKIQTMNPNAPLPKRLRLKVRLDRDGQGGMDQPGDLVGTLEGVSLGDSTSRIVISEVVR